MKKIKALKSFALIVLIALGFTSCNNDDDPVVVPDTTITGLAVNSPNLSILVQALTRADLAATLRGTGPYTVFAPTDDAFRTFLAANGFANIDAVPVPALTQILLNHVVNGSIQSTGLTNNTYIKTLGKGSASTTNTLSMYVSVNTTTGVRLNGVSTVITPNIIASNGVIHVVNAVIGLPTVVTHAQANPNFTSLVSALTRQGNTTNFASILSGTASSPFTVFAPTNEAFTAALNELSFATLADIPEPVLDKILKYHVIAGANILAGALPVALTTQNTFLGQTFEIGTNGGAKIVDFAGRTTNIVATDVQCSNGVVHVLNKVLVPNLE